MMPHTIDRYGADLHVGDVIVQPLPDDTCDVHRIGRITEYPGPFIGGHARIAYGTGDTPRWRHTIADHGLFHILAPFQPPKTPPPVETVWGYSLPPHDRLVWPAPVEDPAYPEPVPL